MWSRRPGCASQIPIIRSYQVFTGLRQTLKMLLGAQIKNHQWMWGIWIFRRLLIRSHTGECSHHCIDPQDFSPHTSNLYGNFIDRPETELDQPHKCCSYKSRSEAGNSAASISPPDSPKPVHHVQGTSQKCDGMLSTCLDGAATILKKLNTIQDKAACLIGTQSTTNTQWQQCVPFTRCSAATYQGSFDNTFQTHDLYQLEGQGQQMHGNTTTCKFPSKLHTILI
ncbi:uncharacterized protein [Heterodontus francisci]|uniref:uncharacterized protein n=1 Tax=Heterodontus francisci TaxID=7792 RepID=UPI00355AD53D